MLWTIVKKMHLKYFFIYFFYVFFKFFFRNLYIFPVELIVRAHFRNFWLGKAFFSTIWHAVVLTQFGSADSKSVPCQAIFCVFPTKISKTKWPPTLVKMSQLYIKAWLTMNIKTSFRCIKTHLSNILKIPRFHLVRLPLEDKIQNGRHCKAMCHNFASK